MRAAMMDLDTLKFDDRGLIPAIVQDADTGKVLTLAYMNRKSLEISLEKKLTCFWSRSRQELWLKGRPAATTSTLWNCGRTATGTPCWCG